MSVQQQFKTSDAAPIDQQTALESFPAGCVSKPMPHRETVCPDAFAATCLSIIRYIAAAYTTGESDCWEMALQLGDEAAGTEHGPLLVARLSTLIRTMRRVGNCKPVCLPAPCNRLTAVEQRLMLMIEAARRHDRAALLATASMLVDDHHGAELMQAVDLIRDLSGDPTVAHLCDRTSSSQATLRMPLSFQLDCLGCPASPLARSGQNGRR